MKSLIITIFGIVLFSVANAEDGDKRYSFSFSETPIKEVIVEIEKQTGLIFSYKSSLLDRFPNVTYKGQQVTLEDLLSSIFHDNRISYTIVNNFIILNKRRIYFTISGKIEDAEGGETLIGCVVYDHRQQIGTTTNDHGFYSLTLKEGDVRVTFSFVGYRNYECEFTLKCDTIISLSLVPTIELKEVVVKGERYSPWIRNVLPGEIQIPVKVVNSLPAFLGENDLIKTLQLLPGVQAGHEGMAGLYVRGGNVDENLYLMDGIPLYNPSHAMGFFSIFNSAAVKHIDFYKASFPARYGGRLSSVVDVRMKEGNRDEFSGSLSIGLISTKIDLEGPINRKSSFILSFRRTYMDIFTHSLVRSLTKEQSVEENKHILTYNTGGYYFTDLNAKVTHRFSDRDQLSFTIYWGKDHVKYMDYRGERDKFSSTSGDYFNTRKTSTKWKWNWGNMLVLMEYGLRVSDRLYGQFSLSYNRYNSKINIPKHIIDIVEYNVDSYISNERRSGSKFRSGIEDVTVKSCFEYNLGQSHNIYFGAEYIHHTFIPEMSSMDDYSVENNELTESIYFETRNKVEGNELSLYAEDEIRVGERVHIDPGVRFSLFAADNKSYIKVEPRLALQYAASDRLTVKLSYSEMSQYIHLLAYGGISMPSDLWVPVTRKVKPMRSNQIACGVYYSLYGSWQFSMDGYYKTMRNRIEFLDGSSVLPEYREWEESIASGKGDAYGVELQIQKNMGETTGWVNYTLSWANCYFPGKEINHGERFPFKNDSRHSLNIVLLHRFNEKFDISAAWVYHTGMRATLSLEQYEGADIEGVHDIRPDVSHIEYRNNYKLPDYHRLDIGCNFHRKRKRGTSTWSVSVYNLYSRLNPSFVYAEGYTGFDEKRRTELKQAAIFPIIPSFSYTFKF